MIEIDQFSCIQFRDKLANANVGSMEVKIDFREVIMVDFEL
jgi:hypothetical protein